jgi:hypothetical protein
MFFELVLCLLQEVSRKANNLKEFGSKKTKGAFQDSHNRRGLPMSEGGEH